MNIYETYFNVIIPVTCRVDGYTRKRKWKEESAFLIRLNSRVDLALSIYLSARPSRTARS